jgi:hypothetical protein
MNDTHAPCFTPVSPFVGLARASLAAHHALAAAGDATMGFARYAADFTASYLTSVSYFNALEAPRLMATPPDRAFEEYARLGGMNLDLFLRALSGANETAYRLLDLERERAVEAIVRTLVGAPGEDLADYMERQAAVAAMVARGFPAAMDAIVPEYGFHFERYDEGPCAETDRFTLWRVRPTDPAVAFDPGRKPLLIVPPYVLGANILAFLPGEERSYAHAFANQGIPTYIRVMKSIHDHEAVQVMDGEDDARDMRALCEQIVAVHGTPVTLNGYCQGGYSSLCNILSGELDGLVDALVTCVSPMDGTRSLGLKGFLDKLPAHFNDLDFGTKTLPNGNRVADGRLMGWVYKLKSIESESPVGAFLRDVLTFAGQKGPRLEANKSAAAINYWLANERTDLPLAITRMSFAAYNEPIAADGTLPVRLFGRRLNLDRLAARQIPWLICYGERDDLVEKECALAPTRFVDAETTEFPRGHVAIATSWSHPASACALHRRFGPHGARGPVRWHLDLEAAARAAHGS